MPVPLRPLETIWEDWLDGRGVASAFADPRLPLEVEVGPGEDDWLLEAARACGARSGARACCCTRCPASWCGGALALAGPLPNLRLVWRPAADVIGPFLTPAKVAGYHVHFPDPWPKKHHARYRLMGPEFVSDLAASLALGGRLEVATDSRAYMEQMLEVLAAEPRLRNCLPAPGWREPPPGERATVFERRWREAGRAIHALCFEACAAPAG